MKFSIEKNEHYALIQPQEEKLTSMIAPKLKSEFMLLFQEEHTRIICDLSDVKYIDSSGLSALLIGHRLCREESEGSFILTNIAPSVKSLITLSRLDDVLTLIPTNAEAIDFVKLDNLEGNLDA